MNYHNTKYSLNYIIYIVDVKSSSWGHGNNYITKPYITRLRKYI
jgi:hypothetical protein